MFSYFVTSIQEVFNRAVSILSETPAYTAKALSSTTSHCNITSTNRFGTWSATRLLDLRKYYSRCDLCQQDEYTELAIAFLFTASAFFAFVCINNIICYTPDPQVRPETTRLHALERAITRQIEINYHLSRLSVPLGRSDRTCKSDDSKKWAAQWFVIDRFRDQAEADFKRGVPSWYYDNYPDFTKSYHALKEELARLQSLGRNIVNAREEARKC
jgi:hypothetical protein